MKDLFTEQPTWVSEYYPETTTNNETTCIFRGEISSTRS